MSRLFKIKQWVSIQQALDFLSLQLEEDVTLLDVLQLVIGRGLKISVKLDYRVPAYLGKAVPMEDVPVRELPSMWTGGEKVTYLDGYRLVPEDGGKEDVAFACFDSEINFIDGVWDLAMMGNEAIQVADMLQGQLGAADLELINIEGTFLCKPDGSYANLQERFDPRDDAQGFYAASGLPENSMLVFRTAELTRFITGLDTAQADEKPLETRERNTLLLIIAALCRDAGHDYVKSSKTALAIQSTLDSMEVKVGESTIRGHLKEIPNALESRKN